MLEVISREFIYIAYYFEIQLKQIFLYWVIGMLIGSFVSVFAKDIIHSTFQKLQTKKFGTIGIVLSSMLGIASPLCMYGTIPIAASFKRQGAREDWLSAFMMSSILLNPQLIVYSAALGTKVLTVRIITCFVCGCIAGLLLKFFFKEQSFFDFKNFTESSNRDTHPNKVISYVLNFWRNIKATALYFLVGILLSAIFQRYVSGDVMSSVFGGNKVWGVLMASTIGVPLYACGGGTIPLLQQWLSNGMSIGSGAAFMITGPATKITNLGALKITLGWKRFLQYIAFVMLFSFVCGLVVNVAG